MHNMYQVPVLQFLEAVADVGPGDSQGFGNFVRSHRFTSQIEQGMDLRDGAVDPPLGAHLAPVKNKSLCYRMKFHGYTLAATESSVNTEITDVAASATDGELPSYLIV
jgi:hypothetical protein